MSFQPLARSSNAIMFHKKNDKIDFKDSIWWFHFNCEIRVYDFFFFFFPKDLILAWFERLIILILIQYPWIYGDDFDSKEIPSVDKTRDWVHSRPLSWYSLIHQGFNSCLYKQYSFTSLHTWVCKFLVVKDTF